MTQGTSRFDLSPENQSTDWEALARHVTGESSPEESARVDAWLAGHPDNVKSLPSGRAMSRRAEDVPADIDIEVALSG